MSQENIVKGTYYDAGFIIACPHCGHPNRMALPSMYGASMRPTQKLCIDCNKDFYVEVFCLTRAAELPLEPSVDTPKACNRNYHDLIEIFQGAKYCPECGERLSS